MGHDTPEQHHHSDDPEGEQAWQQLSAELMGKDASPEGIAAVRREIRESDEELRRLELRNRIFEAGDLLTRASAEFPDRTALLGLLTASEQLTDALLAQNRTHQLRVVVNELKFVLNTLEHEAAKHSPPQD